MTTLYKLSTDKGFELVCPVSEIYNHTSSDRFFLYLLSHTLRNGTPRVHLCRLRVALFVRLMATSLLLFLSYLRVCADQIQFPVSLLMDRLIENSAIIRLSSYLYFFKARSTFRNFLGSSR